MTAALLFNKSGAVLPKGSPTTLGPNKPDIKKAHLTWNEGGSAAAAINDSEPPFGPGDGTPDPRSDAGPAQGDHRCRR